MLPCDCVVLLRRTPYRSYASRCSRQWFHLWDRVGLGFFFLLFLFSAVPLGFSFVG
ncbi:hypothetical protein RchiOBHm_Chr2g0173031 [Rosa chinensis]|uniref:Uncharacterized protein n=1 Tax=Rosa chinensis TaxID=74649 RepID=A0A2P6S5S9_ROSCH|nr:hypothetical protein RchiOBHm_Chr2g0173031 [Rosa chinensis]